MKNNNISNNQVNKTRNTNPINISFLLTNEKKKSQILISYMKNLLKEYISENWLI